MQCINNDVVYSGCVEAGFNTSCCEPSVDQTCEIGGSSGFATCSCDAGCFANGNCCDDILDVPCLPGEIYKLSGVYEHHDLRVNPASVEVAVMCIHTCLNKRWKKEANKVK